MTTCTIVVPIVVQNFLINDLSKIRVTGTRSSHRRCSVKKGVLNNFEKFTGKHLSQSSFLIKLEA